MGEYVYEKAAESLLLNADLAIVWLNFGPDAIIVVDDQGQIWLVNRQAELLTGYTRDELHGQCVDILLPDALRDTHQEHRAGFMDDPKLRPMGQHLDLRMARKNGTEVCVDINLSPVTTSKGVYVVATIRRKARGRP